MNRPSRSLAGRGGPSLSPDSPRQRGRAMLPVTPMPMPGALRLRALHPLIEGDGSCSLVYDLERAAVVEVPEELQFHVAPALETGDLDEALVGWLVNEDLLTSEGSAGWSASPRRRRPAGGGVEPRGDLPHRRRAPRPHRPGAGGRRPGGGELRVPAGVRRQPGEAPPELGRDLPGHGRCSSGSSSSPPASPLCCGQEIAFELTLAAREVTPGGRRLPRRLRLPGAAALRQLSGAPRGVSTPISRLRARRGRGWEAEPAVRLLLAPWATG